MDRRLNLPRQLMCRDGTKARAGGRIARRGASITLRARVALRLLLVAGFVLMLVLVETDLALANGHSYTLYLSYLANLSNWGPQDATGTAAVNVGEGTVHLEATGLPGLDGQVYEIWLVSADLSTWTTLGRFEPGPDGDTVYDGESDQVEPLEYRYLLLSVEPMQDDDPAPSGDFSIGGIFPNLEAIPTALLPAVVTPVPAAIGEDSAAESLSLPAAPPPTYLPETGGGPSLAQFGPIIAAVSSGVGATVAARAVCWGGRHARRLHR